MTNWLDNSIAAVAPGWAASRAEARARLLAFNQAREIQARYEGASRGRRMVGWNTVSGGSAVAETQGALALLRARARDLTRNTWAGRRAVNILVHNMIGTGIRPSLDGESPLEEQIKKWAKSTRCDQDGLHNLYGIQALAVRTMIESGESLIIRRPQKFTRKNIPLKLRVLEGDYLDEGYNQPLPNGNTIVQGVEFDRFGNRVAYHLFKKHPGDMYTGTTGHERVRMSADDVIHLFRVLRPGQVRGITDFAAVIIKLREWDSYEDAQLVRQKIAACFTAFVRTDSSVLPGDADAQRELGTKVEPGIIEILRPGESVTFGTPPDVGGYKDYADITLREIAAGIGITYEALTSDLRGVNFSSGRLGWLEFQRKIDSDRALLYEPRMLEPIAEWLLNTLTLTGDATGDEDIKWTPPRRQMIDPSKEINAAKASIRAGLSSRQAEIRGLGRDPEEVMAEIAADNAAADALQLFLDSDPRFQNKPEANNAA